MLVGSLQLGGEKASLIPYHCHNITLSGISLYGVMYMSKPKFYRANGGGSGFARGIRDSEPGLLLLFVFFISGSIAGTLVGSFTVTEDVTALISDIAGASSGGVMGYIKAFWSCSKFHLAALVLSTSLLGAALIPALASVRGYMLSLTAASIIKCYPADGFLLTLTVLLIPALFTVPSFFVLSRDALAQSKKLWSLATGTGRGLANTPIFKDMLGCIIALAIAAVTEEFLVPVLVKLIL